MEEIKHGMLNLFEERKRFAILGLTGRTASGCTTVSKILSNPFNQLCLSKDVYDEISFSEKLRYEIIENYLKENWIEFKVIRTQLSQQYDRD